jgi:hypothetical protein
MTRLRSIYLYYNNNEELKSLLHHIPHNASYLLSIKSEGTEYRQVSSDIVSSLLTKYSFEKLHLHNDVKYDGHRRQEKFWPAQCKLKSLLISGCTIDEYYVILQELPYLKTLVIQKWAKPGRDESLTTPQILNSSLTSLTFNKCSLRFSHVVPLLSFTRELTHLKLICDSKKFDGLFDGQYWEGFIQKNLCRLKQFQFFFSNDLSKKDKCTPLDDLIASFRSPFWLKEKRWFVECNFVLNKSIIWLYTTPICVSGLESSLRCEISAVDNVCRLIQKPIYPKTNPTSKQVLCGTVKFPPSLLLKAN